MPNFSPTVLSPGSNHRSLGPERGFSLTELMVAMMLGLLVIAASGNLYVGSRDAQRIVDTKTSLTENTRFAMDFLGRDLRMAGYFSCGDYRTKIANAVDEGDYWQKVERLEGFKVGVDTLPTIFKDLPTPLPDTDVLIIRYADTRSMVRVGATSLDISNKKFAFAQPHGLRRGDIAILNDAACSQTTIFQVTDQLDSDGSHSISFDPASEAAFPGNCTHKLAGDYTCAHSDISFRNAHPKDNFSEATISKLVARAFFVANAPADECTPPRGNCPVLQDCPTLFVAGNEAGRAVPLLSNVTRMEVSYGVNDDIQVDGAASTDSTIDRYLDADEVGKDNLWPKVASVSIRLTFMQPTGECGETETTVAVALRNTNPSTLLNP